MRRAGPILSFCVISDLHFMAWKETDTPVDWVAIIDESLQDIADQCRQNNNYVNSIGPQLLVINGDLTNGKERDYRLAMRILNRHRLPTTLFSMGNHEYYGYWEPSDYDGEFTVAKAQERFLAFTGMNHIYYSYELNRNRFVFLSQDHYTPELKDAGWISKEQMNWFEQQLFAERETAQPLFVFSHQPLNETVAESSETFMQSEDIQAMLEKRPGVVWFSGHTHCRMDRPDQIVSSAGILYVGGGCLHNDTPQSRWIDVYEDRIILKLRDHARRQWIQEYEMAWQHRVR